MCATVEGRCLEYLVCITLGQVSFNWLSSQGQVGGKVNVKLGSILDQIRVKTGSSQGQDGVNLGSIQIGGFNSLVNN